MIIFSLVLYASRIIFLSISRASRAFLPILWPGRFVVPCCRLLNIFCKFRVKFMALILKCRGPDTLLVLIFLNIGRWDWPILSFGVLYSENIEIISTPFNCKQTSVEDKSQYFLWKHTRGRGESNKFWIDFYKIFRIIIQLSNQSNKIENVNMFKFVQVKWCLSHSLIFAMSREIMPKFPDFSFKNYEK